MARRAPVTKSAISKVLLVDDHPVVRESLALRIGQERDLSVCADVDGFVPALDAVVQHQPDLAIIDMNLPDGHGLELIQDIKVRSPTTRMLVFSMNDENLYAERALRAGAQGYVMKSESPEKVLEAMRKVLTGGCALSEALSRRLLTGATHNACGIETPVQVLSDRELEVFRRIGEGMGTKEIARLLHRSIRTIESHCVRIKSKLGIRSASELVDAAARWLLKHA